jgi:hypothetical protein
MFERATLDVDQGDTVLLRSTDGGLSWHRIFTPVAFQMIDFPDSLIGYAVHINESEKYIYKIYKTTDGGETWKKKGSWSAISEPIPGLDRSYGIWCNFATARKGFVGIMEGNGGSRSYRLYRTTDGGDGWTYVDADTNTETHIVGNRWISVDSLHFYSMGTGALDENYWSSDGGETWSDDFHPEYIGGYNRLAPIPTKGLALYSHTWHGNEVEWSIVVSHNYGKNWEGWYDFATRSGQNIYTVEFFDSTYGLAFSSLYGNGVFDTARYMPIRTTDGGLSWYVFSLPFPSPELLVYVECSLWRNGTGYALNRYEIVKTTDYGATWFPVSITTDAEGVKSTPDKCGLLQTYPNPVTRASGSATLSYELSMASHVRIALVDMMGRTVRAIKDDYNAPGSFIERLDVSGLVPGVYLITMFAGNNPPMVRRMVVR